MISMVMEFLKKEPVGKPGLLLNCKPSGFPKLYHNPLVLQSFTSYMEVITCGTSAQIAWVYPLCFKVVCTSLFNKNKYMHVIFYQCREIHRIIMT